MKTVHVDRPKTSNVCKFYPILYLMFWTCVCVCCVLSVFCLLLVFLIATI